MPIEGPDHPIPPGPDRPVAIRLESVGVSKPGQVKPVGGHAFPIARGTHEALNLLKVVRIGRSAFEGNDLLGSWGQTCQIQGQTTHQSAGIGRWRQALSGTQLSQHEGVNRITALPVPRLGHRR